MNKLFVTLITAITLAFNNLSYTVKEEVQFKTDDDYYSSENHTETDYQSMYKEYINDINGIQATCVIQQNIFDNIDSQPIGVNNSYWVVYKGDGSMMTSSKSKKPVPLNTKDGDYIIAPGKATILTDSGTSDYSRYIQIQVGSYVITFDNLKCWFCDYKRSDSRSSGGFTHDKNAKGFVLNRGSMVGVATTETTMQVERITESGTTPVSIKDYYNGSN